MKTLFFFFLLFLASIALFGQEIKIGFNDSIQSEILNENRKFIIKLPNDYQTSDKSYPVMYRLDGSLNMFTETVGIVNRLAHMEELMPDMIIVMIENTNRNRDMMPIKSDYLQAEPGADKFKAFIETELIPHINSTYRTTNEKLLCGQSLSAIFTLYYFLTSPDTFNTFIACSGAFLDREDFFIELTDEFLEKKQDKSTNLFLTHGDMDELDPQGIFKKQLIDFSKKIETKENVTCKLKVYKDEGHVPFQSLYHGLRFIYAPKNTN